MKVKWGYSGNNPSLPHPHFWPYLPITNILTMFKCWPKSPKSISDG
jgi:hypothetical protein